MKKTTFFLAFIFASVFAHTQVTIPVDSIVLGGISFRASAVFEVMIWNARSKEVSLQWQLNVWGRDSSIVLSRTVEQRADDHSLVYVTNGQLVPDSAVIITDTLPPYSRTHNGVPVIGEYSFYALIAQYGAGGATINDLIKAAGERRLSIFKR